MRKTDTFVLASSTKIDVVATRGEEIIIKTMELAEAKHIKKAKGWRYQNFQIGFHSYKPQK